MTDLTINPALAERLQAIAEHEGRSLEETLTILADRYETQDTPPGSTIPDEVIDVPPDVSDAAEYRAGVRRMRPLLYQRARDYWRRVGDTERLALTNAQLDEQFWLLSEGVPYLKSDQGKVEIPPDPLELLVGLFPDIEITDLSSPEAEDAITEEHFRKRWERWQS